MGSCYELEKCVKCKGKNKVSIVNVDGLYYVRCGCGKWGQFQFLGLRERYAVEEWNLYNRPIKRIGNKKK